MSVWIAGPNDTTCSCSVDVHDKYGVLWGLFQYLLCGKFLLFSIWTVLYENNCCWSIPCHDACHNCPAEPHALAIRANVYNDKLSSLQVISWLHRLEILSTELLEVPLELLKLVHALLCNKQSTYIHQYFTSRSSFFLAFDFCHTCIIQQLICEIYVKYAFQ